MLHVLAMVLLLIAAPTVVLVLAFTATPEEPQQRASDTPRAVARHGTRSRYSAQPVRRRPNCECYRRPRGGAAGRAV